MAASLGRRLSTILPRRLHHIIRLFSNSQSKCTNYSNIIRVSPGSNSRAHGPLASGTGLGITLGFLGFSFGKKEDEEDKSVDILTRTYRNARLAHQEQNLKKADELYHECLKIAEDQLKLEEIDKDKLVTTRTLVFDGLANIAMATGRMEDAMNLFIETMKGCLNQGMDVTDNVMVEISLKLSSIYAMHGMKEKAEEGYSFCVLAQTHKLGELEKRWAEEDKKAASEKRLEHAPDQMEKEEQDTAALLGMALGSYGRYLLHERRYKEALPYFERGLVYAKHTLGTNSNQYIIVLNDLATLHIVSQNHEEAERILNDGITIAENAKLKESALLYCNLGAIHLRKGMPEEASKTCQTAQSRAKEFNHTMAFKMAEACMKKSASVMEAKT